MADRTTQLLAYLARADGWVTASELAELLGVSTRSVRSYVTAVKAATRPREVLASLISRLTDAPDGLDVHELAASLFVSESTIEADLRHVRTLASDAGVTLQRAGSIVRLAGPETGYRHMISRMLHEEGAGGILDLRRIQDAFHIGDLRAFKSDVARMLRDAGYQVNEFGLDGVLVHAAIAVERSRAHPVDAPADAPDDAVEAGLARLVEQHFGSGLPPGELAALAWLLTTRAGTREAAPGSTAEHLATLRRIVRRAGDEYLVDLDDPDFLARLSLHVSNLVARARLGARTPNPLTRTIKTGYPLTYEVAVLVSSEVRREFGIDIDDDEIAYIALHIGSHLQRRAPAGELPTATLVGLDYHDLSQLLEARILAALGSELRIEEVVTRSDATADEFTTDLVITTLPWPAPPAHVVVVRPLPSDEDIDAIRSAVARVRRRRRRRALAHDLLGLFDPALFVRRLDATDADGAIRELGGLMVREGVIDEAHVDGVIERERLSSTAFTEWLAVPHSMSMTARRTAIAVALLDAPLPWGDQAVRIVALVAFSEEERGSFQAVFERFVELFSDRLVVRRLLERATGYAEFVDELLRVIDE
jgi:lichenan operon transcriptional antiterminator